MSSRTTRYLISHFFLQLIDELHLRFQDLLSSLFDTEPVPAIDLRILLRSAGLERHRERVALEFLRIDILFYCPCMNPLAALLNDGCQFDEWTTYGESRFLL